MPVGKENEHVAYGIPFYTVAERGKRLDEACRVITSLFREHRVDFDGAYYKLIDAPLDPKPVQNPLPLLVGGAGEKVTMRIAARYAQEWNIWGYPNRLRKKGTVLDTHCDAIGRDPATISPIRRDDPADGVSSLEERSLAAWQLP